MYRGNNRRNYNKSVPARQKTRGNAFLRLSAQTELLNNRFVGFELVLFEIVQKLAAAIRQSDQTVAAVEVLLVRAQVIRQVSDARGKKSNLDFGGTRVLIAEFVIIDDFGFVIHSVLFCFQSRTVSRKGFRVPDPKVRNAVSTHVPVRRLRLCEVHTPQNSKLI